MPRHPHPAVPRYRRCLGEAPLDLDQSIQSPISNRKAILSGGALTRQRCRVEYRSGVTKNQVEKARALRGFEFELGMLAAYSSHTSS